MLQETRPQAVGLSEASALVREYVMDALTQRPGVVTQGAALGEGGPYFFWNSWPWKQETPTSTQDSLSPGSSSRRVVGTPGRLSDKPPDAHLVFSLFVLLACVLKTFISRDC